MYGKGLQRFAAGEVNWGTGSGGDAIHVDLIDLADYTVSLTGDEFRSAIAGAARVATFGPLAGKTLTLGVLDAADFVFTAVTGDQAEALVYWKNTGADASSPLLVFVDTAVSGLPVTPNSGDINVIHNAAGVAVL
jgi:hypothetical protein